MKTYNFDDYGAVSNGTSDCTAIWNKIVTAIGDNSAVIEFGAGTYLFTSMISLDLNKNKKLNCNQAVTIRGQGKKVTTLLWDKASSSGLKLSHSDEQNNECQYNIYDMSFITTDSNKETAIEIKNKSSTVWGGGNFQCEG